MQLETLLCPFWGYKKCWGYQNSKTLLPRLWQLVAPVLKRFYYEFSESRISYWQDLIETTQQKRQSIISSITDLEGGKFFFNTVKEGDSVLFATEDEQVASDT